MIDRQTGLDYCGGDEEFYMSILKDYADEAAEKTSHMEQDIAAEDWKDYTIVVHSLKSTSMLIGATNLAVLAEAHQRAAENGDSGFVRQNYPLLKREYDAVLHEIVQDCLSCRI